MSVNPDAAFSRGDIMRRLADLERVVRGLQTGRRLEAASVGAGGVNVRGGSVKVLDDRGGSVELGTGRLAVKDPAGNVIIELGRTNDGRYGLRVNNTDGAPQIRAGELAGGGYGLEAVNAAGQLVALSTLAFGLQVATVNTYQSTTSLSFTDLTTVGPTVPDVVVGNRGQCLVLFGCHVQEISTDQVRGGTMSFAISGATSLSAGVDHVYRISNSDDGIVVSGASSNNLSVRAVAAHLVTGLNPGVHTFTAKYLSQDGGTVSFGERIMIVIPW